MDDAVELERLALRAWMFDYVFVAKAKAALMAFEVIEGRRCTPDEKRALIMGAYSGHHDWSKPLTSHG